jgi:periplasmic protein TonB
MALPDLPNAAHDALLVTRVNSLLLRARPVLLAALALACMAAQAQFARVPQPLTPVSLRPSDALTEKAYRKDAARHLYDAYPSRVLKGMVPPLVYAILIIETQVDVHGKVLAVRVLRRPASAREVTPWVVSRIRRASPLPPPARMGRVKYLEIWLVDKSGQFQVDSLTEGQL